MSRGTYSPVARDKHFIVGWGEDRLTDYARDRTLGAVTRPLLPLLPVLDKAERMGRAARWMRTSYQIGGRGGRDKPFAQVGGEFFHSIKDRQLAIMRISSDFRALVNDLTIWHAANPGAPNAAANMQWIAADVTPTLEEWRVFLKHQDKSWWTKAATDWETFEDWQDRLRRLRGLARAHGIALESREPKDLPATVWERGAEGKGTEGAALLGVLKVAVAASLGVMGFVTMYAVVRELRAPRTAAVLSQIDGTSTGMVSIGNDE